MVFTTEGFLEVAIESWPEWDLNPRPLYIYIYVKYSRLSRQTDHGQTELNNMVVKKSSLNEINKEGTFTQGFKD